MLIPLEVGCTGLIAGCTFPSKAPVVSRQQVNQVRHIEYGTVQKTDAVVIAGQNSVVGTYGGGAMGAASAGGVGHGVGTDMARVGGAVVGAVAGQAVEEVVTRKNGLMMTIKLENGGSVVVAQEAPPVFNVGDRVAVISGPGGSQVTLP